MGTLQMRSYKHLHKVAVQGLESDVDGEVLQTGTRVWSEIIRYRHWFTKNCIVRMSTFYRSGTCAKRCFSLMSIGRVRPACQ